MYYFDIFLLKYEIDTLIYLYFGIWYAGCWKSQNPKRIIIQLSKFIYMLELNYARIFRAILFYIGDIKFAEKLI